MYDEIKPFIGRGSGWEKAEYYRSLINNMEYINVQDCYKLKAFMNQEYRKSYNDNKLYRYYRYLFVLFNENMNERGAGNYHDYDYEEWN